MSTHSQALDNNREISSVISSLAVPLKSIRSQFHSNIIGALQVSVQHETLELEEVKVAK